MVFEIIPTYLDVILSPIYPNKGPFFIVHLKFNSSPLKSDAGSTNFSEASCEASGVYPKKLTMGDYIAPSYSQYAQHSTISYDNGLQDFCLRSHESGHVRARALPIHLLNQPPLDGGCCHVQEAWVTCSRMVTSQALHLVSQISEWPLVRIFGKFLRVAARFHV